MSPQPSLSEDDLRELGFGGDEPPRVPWATHLRWLEESWHAGQHVSIFAPTEGGKTHLIRFGLLPLWTHYPVLWIRFKQRDATLRGMTNIVRAYPDRLRRLKWASRAVDSPKWESDPEWFILVIPAYHWSADPKREDANWRKARAIAGAAIDKSFHEGGWVLVVDEVRGVAGTSAPALDLGAPLENNWQRGRDQPITVIGGTQQPANAPSSMYDQPMHLYLGPTLDTSRVQRLGEIGGNTELIKRTLPTLRPYEFLYVHRQSHRMEIIRAPRG